MEAICIPLTTIIKAIPDASGRRICEVQASSQDIDLEGDVICQKALLDSAKSFVANGHVDIDHISEIGSRMGIPNPTSWIIGKPLEVKDIGDKCTSVTCEIMRAADGKIDTAKNKYDEFWSSLQTVPMVRWRSSIYGYPHADATSDCREESCEIPAKRYLVRGMDWRSLAMTRKPVNDSIKGYAKIVTAKAMIAEMQKDGILPFALGNDETDFGSINQFGTDESHQAPYFPHITPKNINELWGQYNLHISKECPHTRGYAGYLDSTAGFKSHFKACCGAEDDYAEMLAHALMWLNLKEKYR